VSTLSSKARCTRDILVEAGIHTACLASSRAADRTLPRERWNLPVVGRGPTLGTDNRQHRRRTMCGGAASSLAQSGGAIEFLTQPARERGDDTDVIFE